MPGLERLADELRGVSPVGVAEDRPGGEYRVPEVRNEIDDVAGRAGLHT